VRFAHQLDYATSGILLAATSRAGAAAAARCFADRTARKAYRCIVLGHPRSDAWSVDAAVSYDETDPTGFRMRCDDAGAGKPATTAFRVLSRGACALEGPFLGADVAHVEARPRTGRRHQIRVHAAASGHPILGDAAYSPDRDSFRMFLHARSLFLPLQAAKGEAPREALRLTAALPRSFAVAMVPRPRDEDGEADDESWMCEEAAA
jgi:tRNA pseudouridine32 synthase/23S rRNA pseudouridine746 synthase